MKLYFSYWRIRAGMGYCGAHNIHELHHIDLPEIPMRVCGKSLLMILPLSAKSLIIERRINLKNQKNPFFTTLSFLFR
jgi:hypothetical protein